jgi:hypothetical protein
MGENGSGKSSGSGHHVARAMLGYGFGGIILTVKPEECQLWKNHAAETGRTPDLIIVEPGGARMSPTLISMARRIPIPTKPESREIRDFLSPLFGMAAPANAKQ